MIWKIPIYFKIWQPLVIAIAYWIFFQNTEGKFILRFVLFSILERKKFAFQAVEQN